MQPGRRAFPPSFWTFLFAENLYDFGLYIFVLLYNLYLLDLGYREDFLGWVASAMTAGSILGSLPSAGVARRLGLKRMLVYGSAGMAAMCAVRALPLGGPGLMAVAFIAGLISSVWAVSLPPVVAALTDEKNRPLGFSLWTGWGIGLGVICGAVAGALPGWILRTGIATGPVDAKRAALFLGSAVALLSPLLLVRLPLAGISGAPRKVFPHSPVLRRYLAAFAVWNLAVGAFNPFFSAYFSRHLHMPVATIGVVFSISQAVQLAALLSSPALLRALGIVEGIALTQVGAGIALAVLALSPPAIMAAAAYSAFMAFQYMSEPGTFTLLMNQVEEGERAGVSALNFFVMSGSQAAASGIAGVAVTRYGYPPVLAAAAALAALAACLFRALVLERHTEGPEHPRLPPLPPEPLQRPHAVVNRSAQGRHGNQ